MANAISIASIVAKEALVLIDNNLSGLIDSFYRDYEGEYAKNVNGYSIGDTISIRKPADFTVRNTQVRSTQDIVEKNVTMTVDQPVGVDFDLTVNDLTLNIEDRAGVNGLRDRVIRPAAVSIVNDLVRNCMSHLYQSTYNWVGTPGTRITNFTGFSKAPERMDEMAVPTADRFAALNPNDNWGILGGQTGLYIQKPAEGAYREGSLGMVGGVETYASGVLPTHTVGPLGGTPLINGASQNVTYASLTSGANVWTQSLITDGWTAAAASRVKAGDVFTIANVFSVNPRTKQNINILQQFVVVSDGSSDGSGNLTLTISPPIITSGPHQTVNAAPADNAALTFLGTASTGYRQNLVYHKNAFALAVVPMAIPPGSVGFARESYKGLSMLVGPIYDGINHKSGWRMDMLFARKTIDPRLSVRLSGT
jgi:hypothetical protein